MNNTSKLLMYSNSWGHLIISCVCIVCSVILMLFGDVTAKASGASLLVLTTGYWFISGTKSHELENKLSEKVNGQPDTKRPDEQS